MKIKEEGRSWVSKIPSSSSINPQKPLPECILIHQTINAAFFEDDESPFRVSVKTGPDHDGLAACFEGRFQTCPIELLTLATE